MKRWLATALVLLALVAGRAEAVSSGIFDQAREGCTCHGIGSPLVNTTTRLVIDGLPSEGYTPGATHTLTIWVLGASVPVPLLVAQNLRGFNLEVTAGPLVPLDLSVEVDVRSECSLMSQVKNCDPSSDCGVIIDDPETTCRNAYDCFVRYCAMPGASGCRACSPLVFAQAAHTARNGFGPAAGTPAAVLTDGNSVLSWQVRWTAPDPGVGDVSFYLAGNVVNGNGEADTGDTWSALPSPIVVPQATP